MDDFKIMKGIDKDLLKELECPICMEYMKPPIRMCENGHSICESCKRKLNLCPSCRKPFTNVRNLALESISNLAGMPAEKSNPPTSGHKCPFAKISNEDCSWTGRLKNMKKHIRTAHNNPADAHVSDGNFNVLLTDFSPTRHYRKVQMIDEEIFYVFWEVKQGNFYCIVLHIGCESDSANFKYKFSLSSNTGIKNISMTFETKSILEDLDDVMKPGECVFLHYDTVVQFLDQNKTLSCDFRVGPIGASFDEMFRNSKNEHKRDLPSSSGMSASKNKKGEIVDQNEHLQNLYYQQDLFRGRGFRPGRRGRIRGILGKWGRGRRGFGEMNSSGPLGLFVEDSGSLCKGKKLGWSASDLTDEKLYQAEEASSSDTKKSSQLKEKNTKKSTLKSNIDSMSNNELREFIKQILEGEPSSQPATSNRKEYSEARRPSSSSESSSRETSFSPKQNFPKDDVRKLLKKSFNDKPVEKKTSSESKKIPAPSTTSSASSDGEKKGKPTLSDLIEMSSEKNRNDFSGVSTAGNKATGIYPTKFLENLASSLGDKSQNKPSKPKASNSEGEFGSPIYPGNSQNINVNPTAPKMEKFNPSDMWLCTLCNHMVSSKTVRHPLGMLCQPEGMKWFCNLCEQWRA